MKRIFGETKLLDDLIEIIKAIILKILLPYVIILYKVISLCMKEEGKMKWSDVRENYRNKWIVLEALKAKSEEGKRIIEDLAIIAVFDNGSEALKHYSSWHKKDKSKEMYVYNTANESLDIEERLWVGVRSNG